MASGGFPPNPYGQRAPFHPGQPQEMFRSQHPRPRFHQQNVPHFTGPGHAQFSGQQRFPRGEFRYEQGGYRGGGGGGSRGRGRGRVCEFLSDMYMGFTQYNLFQF